jgi:hypothetical protein
MSVNLCSVVISWQLTDLQYSQIQHSFTQMFSSNADTRPCLWFISCTVKYTTVTTWYCLKALWQTVQLHTGRAKHAYSTSGQVRRPFLNSIYEAVTITGTKTCCIYLLSLICNTKNINVTFDFADWTTALKCHFHLWYTKQGTVCYLPVNCYVMAHRHTAFLVTVRQTSILLSVSHSVHSNNTTVQFSML